MPLLLRVLILFSFVACRPFDLGDRDFVDGPARGWMYGYLLDYVTGAPIEGAEIVLHNSKDAAGKPLVTRSEAGGAYAFVLPEGVKNPLAGKLPGSYIHYVAEIRHANYAATQHHMGMSWPGNNERMMFAIPKASAAALQGGVAGTTVIVEYGEYWNNEREDTGAFANPHRPDVSALAGLPPRVFQPANATAVALDAALFETGAVSAAAAMTVAKIKLRDQAAERAAFVIRGVPPTVGMSPHIAYVDGAIGKFVDRGTPTDDFADIDVGARFYLPAEFPTEFAIVRADQVHEVHPRP